MVSFHSKLRNIITKKIMLLEWAIILTVYFCSFVLFQIFIFLHENGKEIHTALYSAVNKIRKGLNICCYSIALCTSNIYNTILKLRIHCIEGRLCHIELSHQRRKTFTILESLKSLCSIINIYLCIFIILSFLRANQSLLVTQFIYLFD